MLRTRLAAAVLVLGGSAVLVAPATGATSPQAWRSCSIRGGDHAARQAGLVHALNTDPILVEGLPMRPSDSFRTPATSLCGDYDGDGRMDRAVRYDCCTSGAPAPWVVLRRSGSRWRIVYSRLHDPTFRLQGRGTRLVTTEPLYASADPRCCPARLRIGTLRWTGRRFSRTFRTVRA